MLEELRQEVCDVNLALVRAGLVFQTWGNASGIDRERGLVVIKPSGVPYEGLGPAQMAVVDLDGDVIEGDLKPSVDTPTHLVLYRAFGGVGSIVHTHSHFATCWAQARRPIPCFGTTHADYFYGEIPLADALTEAEVAEGYEEHIGKVILRRFEGIDPLHFPGVLAAGHAVFAWGASPAKALESAAVIEEIARMAYHTVTLNAAAEAIEPHLLDKHFLRKHGSGAYYGQR